MRQGTTTCENTVLARGPVLTVEMCRHCGSVSLHVGHTSVRLDKQAVESYWGSLGEAITELHRLMASEEQLRLLTTRGAVS